MSRKLAYIVVPFRLVKGRFNQAEMRHAQTEEGALRMAALMAERFAGVAAFEVTVDSETGEMNDPRELIVHGRLPEIDLQRAA